MQYRCNYPGPNYIVHVKPSNNLLQNISHVRVAESTEVELTDMKGRMYKENALAGISHHVGS